MSLLFLAVPSPTPTAGPSPLEEMPTRPAYWVVIGGLFVLFLVMHTIHRWLNR